VRSSLDRVVESPACTRVDALIVLLILERDRQGLAG
jgi:hypothetical protein